MSQVFISYSHHDGKKITQDIAEQLQQQGNEVWYDTQISGGTLWRRAIIEEIYFCQIVIAVFTRQALTSPWVLMECNIATVLGKKIIPVLVDVLPQEVPDFLRELQMVHYSEASLNNLLNAIQQQKKQTQKRTSKFWRQLLSEGVDIGIPLEFFDGVHAVNVFSLNSALELQKLLLQRASPFDTVNDAVRVVTIEEDGGGLDRHRNWIILGGPGGVPYVNTLLQNWVGNAASDTFTGYRFVTRNNLVSTGPFIRGVENKSEFAVEDVQSGEVSNKVYKIRDATSFSFGTSYAVLYTHGLGSQRSSEYPKTIVLSAFGRAILPALIKFLMEDSLCNIWLDEVRGLNPTTETLLKFTVGSSINYDLRYPTRSLSS